METEPSDLKTHLPLTPAVFHILLALADGELHGYAIIKAVKSSTHGEMVMGPGTLYGTINRLLERRLIEESQRRPDPTLDDERRRYYKLTPLGAAVASAETARLRQLIRVAETKKLLKPTRPARVHCSGAFSQLVEEMIS